MLASRLWCGGIRLVPLKMGSMSLRSVARNIPNNTASTRTVAKDWHYYGRIFLASSAAVGGLAVCVTGLSGYQVADQEVGILSRSVVWPDYVAQRVRNTYLWFGAGLAATAGVVRVFYKHPAFTRFNNTLAKHPFLACIGLMAGTVALNTAQRSIPYTTGNLPVKVALAAGLYGVIGAVLSPMMVLGGPLLHRAAVYTGSLVAGLTLAAVTAPSDKFLNMSGPLVMGFCLVAAASLASVFLPPTGAMGGTVYGIAVYGGVVLFSGFLLYDTQRIVKQSEMTPYNYEYDPIAQSISIYMTTINLFVRIVQILAGNGRNRK